MVKRVYVDGLGFVLLMIGEKIYNVYFDKDIVKLLKKFFKKKKINVFDVFCYIIDVFYSLRFLEEIIKKIKC